MCRISIFNSWNRRRRYARCTEPRNRKLCYFLTLPKQLSMAESFADLSRELEERYSPKMPLHANQTDSKHVHFEHLDFGGVVISIGSFISLWLS